MPTKNRGRIEWEKYKVDSNLGRPSDHRSPLEEVMHIAHADQACDILEDGRLRAGLIYDESRLNRTRLPVNWLSANRWKDGSMYGNVAFHFAWSDLVSECRFYWVEAIEIYSPVAFRILASRQDLSGIPELASYDPAIDDGPLRLLDGRWYWRADKTSEFLIDRDLSISDCLELRFIEHHHTLCRLRGAACKDKDASLSRTGGKVLAFILGHAIHSADHALRKTLVRNNSEGLTEMVRYGAEGLYTALARPESRFKADGATDSHAEALLQGALALYDVRTIGRAKELIGLMSSSDVFDAALTALVNAHFETTGWTY